MLSCHFDIAQRRRWVNACFRDNDHDERVMCEPLNKRCEQRVLYCQALERGLALTATQLELLHDVADLFESVQVLHRLPRAAADHHEGCLLKQNNLICFTDVAEVSQLLLQDVNVGYERVHDLRPRLEERLVPDTRGKAGDLHLKIKILGFADDNMFLYL